MITKEHHDHLVNAHAIKPEIIEAAGVQSHAKGMIFSWSDGDRTVSQARLDDAYRSAGAPRYRWPENTPLVINHFREPAPDEPIILAEGTCQHLAVASWTDEKTGLFGMVGCWGWSGCDLSWAEDRDVFVMFDADLTSNRDVWNAANSLRDALELEGAKSIKFVMPPGSGKEGIDDVLSKRKPETRAPFLTRLFAKAVDKLGRPPASSNKRMGKKIMDQVPMALSVEGVVSIYRGGLFYASADDFNAIMTEFLGADFSRGLRDNLHDYIAGQLRLEGRFLPERMGEPLVNLRNGMLNLVTGEIGPWDPSHLSTVQLPVEWHPDATAPRYERWLEEVIPDQIDDLEESAATMLDPSRTPSKAVFLFGPSRSGKSTFLRIMRAIAGPENTSAVTLHQLAENRFAAANVYGKILNSAADLSARHVEDLSIFKMLTGEDVIHADRKHGRQFAFVNQALFAFSANELPTVGESSRAYIERIKPFHFPHSFAGREDPKREDEIMEELPGILVRWVKAHQRWRERGGYLATATNVRDDFERRSDRVRQFVSECCIVHEAATGASLPGDRVTTKRDFAKRFNQWATSNKGAEMTPRKIVDRLMAIHGVYEVRRSDTGARGVNVSVLPESKWGEEDQPAVPAISTALSPFSIKSGDEGGEGQGQEEEKKEMGDSGLKTAGFAGDSPEPVPVTTSPTTGSDVTVFDLETAGFSIFDRPDFVRLGGTLNGTGPHLTTDGGEIVREIMNSKGKIGGHNITGFDFPALARWHGLDLTQLRGRVLDTDLWVRCDDPAPSGKDGVAIRPKGYYGLDQSAQRYGAPGKTDDFGALARKHGGADKIPTDDPEYRAYLEGDLRANAALIANLPPITPYIEREMNVGLITAQMTVNGWRVDVPELTRTLAEQAERKAANYRELSEITGMPLDKVTKYKTKPDKIEPYDNPLATKEGKTKIVDFLHRHRVKDSLIPRTPKSGDLSTNGEEIRALREKLLPHNPPAELIRALDLICELVGERTVYQTAETCRIGDRVHPSIRPYQATGRWSVTDPGLTVYGKRGGRHVERRIFLPEVGHVLLSFDLDQVDARGVAAHSGDEGYLSIFRNGLDLHGEVAAAVFGEANRKAKREQSKFISHGWNYGRGAKAISSMEGIPYEDAVHFDQQMREQYPALVQWQNNVRAIAEEGELLNNGFGRMLRADPRFAYTQAPALVGQGCTRDILAEGLLRLPVEIWPMLRVIVHDEIVLSVPEADVEDVKRIVLDALQFDLADVTDGRLASVPITAGCSKPGRTWAECYEK